MSQLKSGLSACKQTRNRFDQNRKRRLPSDATRVTQGQDTLHPAIALLATGSLAAFALQDTTSVGAFRDVIGRFDTLNVQKRPQRLPLLCQAPGPRPGLVSPGGVLVEQRVEACLPRPPLPHGGALRCHRTQPLELGMDTLIDSVPPSRHGGVPDHYKFYHVFMRPA